MDAFNKFIFAFIFLPMAGVLGNPPGTWSQWSLLKGCHNNGINGPSKKQFIRTCLNSPCTGQRYYADYDCSSGYIVPGAIVGVYGRDQCGLNPEKPCNSGENFDGEFYLDLPNMKFDDNKRIQLFIKSKLGTNDKPDLALYHNIPSQSFGANGHLRVNLIIDGDNELPFHKKVSRQFVWYRLESAAKEFNTDQITTLGNRFGLIILSQVTFNPSNEQKTHLSVGFDLGHKHLSSPERVISVIQMKRKKAKAPAQPEVIDLDEVGPFHTGNFSVYPGFRNRLTPRILFGGNGITSHIFVQERISQLYFNLDDSNTFNMKNHPLTTSENEFRKVAHLSENIINKEAFTYIPYMDGVTAPNSWIEPRRRYINKMTEFQDSTYLANPISAVIADFNYCFNQDGCEFANPTNFRSDRASLPFSTIQDGLQMPSEPFRIKFKEQGYCWTLDKTSGYNQLILSSKCHDVFSLGRYQFPAHPFSLWHIETGLRVERHGNANNDGNDIHLGSQETDEGETFISRMKCMMIINSWSRASCVYPNGNRLMLKGGRDHITQENPCKFPGVDTRSNYLPDYSAHYNVLNMKNVLQTTLPDGSKILLVCDPKRDLKSVSNCHYSVDPKGHKWKGLTPIITQIKLYIPSENLFYGYCNEVKYHCSWNLQSNQITYLDGMAFINKIFDVESVLSMNFDTIDLSPNSQPTEEDPNIKVTQHGISKFDDGGSTWNEIYVWTN